MVTTEQGGDLVRGWGMGMVSLLVWGLVDWVYFWKRA